MQESFKGEYIEGIAGDELPPTEAMVLAICKTFQCLAFVDSMGIWRNFFGKNEIPSEVIKWRPLWR